MDSLLTRPPHPQSGQALIESCLVIGLLCLILMGMFQLSQLYMAEEILNYAAMRGARARAVGFNDFMVYKTVRIGTIANAGQIIEPIIPAVEPEQTRLVFGGPDPEASFVTRVSFQTSHRPTRQHDTESARIPLYLEAAWLEELSAILYYSNWPTITYDEPVEEMTPYPMVHFSVHQNFSLRIPLHRTFYSADTIPLTGEAHLDNHYPLYLQRSYE